MVRRTLRRIALGLGVVVVVAGAVYSLAVPRLLENWGATEGEVNARMLADELIERPSQSTTMAINISAPADQIWPWLNQMGQERGGFYSYEWLENWILRCEIHGANAIIPEYQMKVGDTVKMHPKMPNVLKVAASEPGRSLVLQGGTEGQGDAASWVFVLSKVDDNTTRLVFRIKGSWQSGALNNAIYGMTQPGSLIMERKMLLGLKERAEAAAGQAQLTMGQ